MIIRPVKSRMRTFDATALRNVEKKLRTATGRVVSNAMDKTVSVAVERLVKRLQMSRWLLLGEVLPLPGGKWRVLLQAFEKDPKSVGVTLLAGARVTAVEMEVGPEEQARVLTLIPGLSDQLLEKLLGAGGLGDMPPPAPVTAPIAPKTR